MSDEKVQSNNEAKFLQNNYIIISIIWDIILCKKESESKYKRHNKERLVKFIGTNKTDFSTFKNSNKRLTKPMKKSIDKISINNFKEKIVEDIMDTDKDAWVNSVKEILKGEKQIELDGINIDEIIEAYSKSNSDVDMVKNMDWIIERLKDFLNKDTKSVGDARYQMKCLLEKVIITEDPQTKCNDTIKNIGDVMNKIKIQDLQNCDTSILERTHKQITNKLKQIGTICYYRKLTENNQNKM